jgi:hypothetical protein
MRVGCRQCSYSGYIMRYLVDSNQSRYWASIFYSLHLSREHLCVSFTRSLSNSLTAIAIQECGALMLSRDSFTAVSVASINFSFSRSTQSAHAVQYDPLIEQAGVIHAMTTDNAGDVVLIGSARDDILQQSLVICQGTALGFVDAQIGIPASCDNAAKININARETQYYLAKFTSTGVPIVFKWLTLGEYDIWLSQLKYDRLTGAMYALSRLFDESSSTGSEHFRASGVLRIAPSECQTNCNRNGWCLLDRLGVGVCQCQDGTYGDTCDLGMSSLSEFAMLLGSGSVID